MGGKERGTWDNVVLLGEGGERRGAFRERKELGGRRVLGSVFLGRGCFQGVGSGERSVGGFREERCWGVSFWGGMFSGSGFW